MLSVEDWSALRYFVPWHSWPLVNSKRFDKIWVDWTGKKFTYHAIPTSLGRWNKLKLLRTRMDWIKLIRMIDSIEVHQ